MQRKKNITHDFIMRLIGSIFSVIGLIALIILSVIAIDTGLFLLEADSTTAILTRFQYDGSEIAYSGGGYYLSYTVEGQEYINVPLSYSSSSHREGQEMKVYYKPDNPGEGKTLFGMLFGVILALPFVVIFTGIGLTFLMIGRKAKKKKETLLSSGRRIDAQITGVSRNKFYQVNGRNPYNIECSYQDYATGRTYLFRSENLWFNPESMIDEKQISIYVDRDNMKKYYVDVRKFQESVVDYR